MKRIFTLALVCLSLSAAAQKNKTQNRTKSDTANAGLLTPEQLQQQQDTTVVYLRLTLSQASTLIYTLRYSTVMNASEGNQFADYLVKQINSQMIKPKEQQPTKH